MSAPTTIHASRLRLTDLLRLGWNGVRAHPARATLSALGIAIGIAAMIAVIGISLSSQAKVQERLAALGTNMLTVTPGESFSGEQTVLPADSAARLRRVDGVEQVSWLAELTGVHAYRNSHIDPGQTNGLTVAAADEELLEVTSASLRNGTWFNRATGQYPTTVLGATAAQRLGIATPGATVSLNGITYTVLGILNPSPLAAELNTSVLVGAEQAHQQLEFSGSPTTLFERSTDEAVTAVRDLIPSTINPQRPNEVSVSRPSDTLAAQNAIDTAFTGLLVGVGSIALLVGGIGVANIMVITVMERRREIGLRRALGATRVHIRRQFMVESVLLASYGGVAGIVLGGLCTLVVSLVNGWTPTLPPLIPLLGITVTILVGAIAGVLPAMRAANTSPTAALST
ncbi:ABC transporter permease [Auritidibacter ignavus]|uniref:ABC transporter permease n=1 Tax=Auritidibacter TaxID=1160973 RepID=UPI001F40B813|nr:MULTISPECIES: ABC transporter permease [Auritidibacter]WGH81128.1 ABC transporter permease [Auritidibacter ignavus]WGH85717.1 ABC transporter permease [Auritidibacter ignavus]WGH88004.1 ABC transporter permease [Auritidibacter ignavus]